ncbi:MAG: TIGR03084 family metal-binding protein [Dermatophilaceae bacterium]
MDATIDRLRAEGEALEALVATLGEQDWARPTPAVGWSIAHQIGHLQWTDEVALLAVRNPAAFAEVVTGAMGSPTIVDDEAAARASLPPAELLSRWRSGRDLLATTLAAATEQVPWFGPPMSPRSMATARIMETWAHGQDVADALGVARPTSARLRDVAHLGVRTRDFSFHINRTEPPAEDFRVELTAPDGDVWTWGPVDAAQRVTGPAEDFCLLVTQRRERDQVEVVATGPDADRWLDFAQAFAGPPKSVVRRAQATSMGPDAGGQG